MLNYDEIVSQASDHRSFLLANAEQQRLTQVLAAAQPHPILARLGQQLIEWGLQLQGGSARTSLSVAPRPESL